VHRSLAAGTTTTIGDGNYFMVGSHIAHDCLVGSRVILANNVLLAGHVVVEDRAYLGGAVAVHQHCRVGRNVMVGGCAAIRQDLPPYVTVDGVSGLIVGLNLIGLHRAGYSREEIDQLKSAYRRIYRSGLKWRDLIDTLRAEYPTGPAAEYAKFFSGGTRGFVQERRSPPKATIKLHRDEELPVFPNKAVG
jgi:UDP-N-acetylglucosamine acyltransferase